jgi:hypothetical protein
MPDSMFLTLYRGRCWRKRNRSLCSGYGTLLGPSGTSSDECLFLDLQNIAFTDYGAKTTPHKPHREGRSSGSIPSVSWPGRTTSSEPRGYRVRLCRSSTRRVPRRPADMSFAAGRRRALLVRGQLKSVLPSPGKDCPAGPPGLAGHTSHAQPGSSSPASRSRLISATIRPPHCLRLRRYAWPRRLDFAGSAMPSARHRWLRGRDARGPGDSPPPASGFLPPGPPR